MEDIIPLPFHADVEPLLLSCDNAKVHSSALYIAEILMLAIDYYRGSSMIEGKEMTASRIYLLVIIHSSV